MHTQGVAVHGPHGGHRVVQVLGIGAVDGEDGVVTKVQAFVYVGLGHSHMRYLLGLGHDLRGELHGYAAALYNCVGADPGPVPGAEDMLHRGLAPVAPAVLDGLYEHLIPVLGTPKPGRLDLQVIAYRAVRGHKGRAELVDVHGARKLVFRARHYAFYLAAGTPVPLLKVP